MPYLVKEYPQTKDLNKEQLQALVQAVKTELHLLADVVPALNFIFVAPEIDATKLSTEQKQIAALAQNTWLSLIRPMHF